MSEVIRICHISDLHLPIQDGIPVRKLFSKRILGLTNLKLFRGQHHAIQPFTRLLNELLRTDPEVTVVTGDLTNLSLDTEFSEIAHLFRKHGFTHNNLLMVPGNHDRYTPGAQWRNAFETAFPTYVGLSTPFRYPSVRMIGPAMLLGLDTAIWRSPHRSAGYLGESQLNRLSQLLESSDRTRRPIVAMHHPPFPLSGVLFKQYLSGLKGYTRLLNILKGWKAIVLHGHIHERVCLQINDTRIIGVPSASNESPHPEKQMAFHTLLLHSDARCELTATTYDPGADVFSTTTVFSEMNGKE